MSGAVAGDMTTIESTVRSAATGDELAFARLVAEHHAAMARVAYVITGDAEACRDAVQSAWAIAWRRLPTLRQPAQIHAWLIAIAANEARQARRRQRRATVVDISAEVAYAEGDDPIESLDLLDLQLAMGGLRPDERSLLAMRYAAGLDSFEIAQQLGVTASAIRSRLSRILERLRADLAIPMETDR